jgi:hypothetical protein
MGRSPMRSQMCLEHGQEKALICVSCRKNVCEKCALFGSHIDHDVRQKKDIMDDIRIRMEMLMDSFMLIDQDCQQLQEPAEYTQRYSNL